ncbi:MAG: TolC family protein [Acidobacteriales bacterium]|nr:MAG: TolC family protein [Terriglobales bacterium]
MRPVLLLFVVAGVALAQPAVMRLGLKEAVDLALAPDGNARARLAAEMVRQAQARSAQARAALLPNLDASVAEQSQTRNLASFGIRIALPIPGFTFPTFVGPFSTFDARISATQSILDFGSIRRYQASRMGIQAAGDERDAAADQVSGQVALQYLAAVRAGARVEATQADAELAGSLLQLSTNQKDAGTGTGIEVTRARVQMAQARQQLLVAQADLRQAQMELLRTIGLPPGTPLRLTGSLALQPVEDTTPEKALDVALKSRADWRAQQKREQTARLSYSGVKMERLPSLVGFGDYGSNGTAIGNSVPTRTVGVALRLPIFDGGRRDARRAESLSQYEQERVRTLDLRRQIDLDVRLALDDLQSATDQVQVASEGLAQVEAEVEQAQRRYKAGVASSLEVTDAQTRLARARDNRIAALFLYSRARLELYQALGTIRQMVD